MATRRPFVCGNWKLHYGINETREVLKDIAQGLSGVGNVDVGIAPVVTTLFAAVDAVKGTKLIISAQNVHSEPKGAFIESRSRTRMKVSNCRQYLPPLIAAMKLQRGVFQSRQWSSAQC